MALTFLGLVLVSAAVGATMIERSSTVAVDGQRYFALFDDGMISMRYADNLASGRGLVWNPGERVEGFSSPLWVFLLAGFIALLGRNLAVPAVQVLGLLLVLSDLALVVLISGRLLAGHRGRDLGAFAATLLTVTFYPLFYWSIMGMETGLLVPVLLGVILLTVKPTVTPRDRQVVALLLSLACLLRPESLLFVVVHYAFRGVRRWRQGGLWRPALAVEATLLVLPIAAYQIFRVAYYRQWIANTHRLKLQGLGLSRQLENGWRFSEPFLLWAAWLALLLAVYLIVRSWRRPRALAEATPGDRRIAGHLLEFLALFVVYACYQIAVGGDAWPLYVRFPVPATVLLIVGIAVAGVLAFERLPRANVCSAGALGITFVLILRWTLALFRSDLSTLTPFYSKYAAADINVALTIKRVTDESATVASLAAGVIPYYSQRRAIDLFGRCDPVIANLPAQDAAPRQPQSGRPGHNKYDLNHSLKEKRPTAIQWFPDFPPCTWGTQSLSPWCLQNYYEIKVTGSHFLVDRTSPLVRWQLMKAGHD
jgi:arabinofuranosyltransferase